MIAIVDYKLGNMASLTAALERLGLKKNLDYAVTNDAAAIRQADRVILPGVGRAKPAMAELTRLGLDRVIKELKVPVLGICLGMQLLADWSEEDNTHCLGCIPAKVQRFRSVMFSIPHIGWNTVQQSKRDQLYNLVPDNCYMYFVHSYYMEKGDWTIGTTQYSQTATAVARWNNFAGVQFHPEKSGSAGLQLLKNFCTDGFQKWLAIDLLDGKCVRLRQGNFTAVTAYNSNPVNAARQLSEQGADGIHVVDLNAVKTGKRVNQKIIQDIMVAVRIPVQIGGGIRSLAIAKQYFDLGAKRLIISTAAFTQPDLLRQLVQQYGSEKIVVGLDVANGKPAIRGWQNTVDLSVQQAVTILKQAGIRTLIVTDVSKDGMLSGPNINVIQNISKQNINVIASGGIANLADIEQCRAIGAVGVVAGKAVYEGKLLAFTKRIIPCLDIANGRVVKGTHFVELKDAGDPVELAAMYSKQGADELILLDIMATVENRATLYELVRSVAGAIHIPFTVGGGVRTLEDIDQLLRSGADKVSIGSAAVTHPAFVKEAAERFGAQCIVISVDAQWNVKKQIWEVYSKGGRENTRMNVVKFVEDMEQLGAGELLMNSLDRDGTEQGYDLALLQAVTRAVNIPVIASSGAGSAQDFVDVFQKTQVSAALAAGMFHAQTISISELKQVLIKQCIAIRPVN